MESPFKAEILKGKVALITGGGSGIGFEISTQFGKHGASIAIMGRRKQVLDSAVSALHSLGIPVLSLFPTWSPPHFYFLASNFPGMLFCSGSFIYFSLLWVCLAAEENRSNDKKKWFLGYDSAGLMRKVRKGK